MNDAATGARVRAAAAQAVDAVVHDGRSLDDALGVAGAGLPARDLPLLRLLAADTLRYYWQFDATIDALASRPPRGKDRILRALLAVGLLQLTQTRIPDHAAVSPTVEAVRLLGRPRAAGFVNALLRRYLRERDTVETAHGVDTVACNHPGWLIEALRQDWPADWRDILAANDARAPMWLRVNTARVTPERYRERLVAAGLAARSMDGLPAALLLEQPVAVDGLPGFADGEVSVQDGAAQLAAPWLLDGLADASRPWRVLDACAAPGGKSAHLAELGGDRIELLSVDADPDRRERIRETFARLKLAGTVRVGDATTPDEWCGPEPFDAILIDAPCSATGVIRRHPDIKHLRRGSDIGALARLQRRLLEALWPRLAPGGRLLYVTCSVLAEENDELLAGFVEATPGAREKAMLQNNNIRDLMRRKAIGYQLLPGTAGMDGFYFACLEKPA